MGTRKITNEAFALFDNRLKYEYAQQCIAGGKARLLFVEAVKSMIGVHETAEDTGPEVDLFLATLGLHKDHWCMAFQQTCVAYVERKLQVTSPIYPSGRVLSVWDNTPSAYRVQSLPLVGAIACFEHMKSKDRKGHTGMVLDCDGKVMHTVEGNQSEQRHSTLGGASLLGNLEGVHLVTRSYDFEKIQIGSGDLQLRGCIKPFEFSPS